MGMEDIDGRQKREKVRLKELLLGRRKLVCQILVDGYKWK